MSICNGVAGNRGRNPIGIFIHNDAGSQNANAAFYRNWLQTHPLENGFAHYYVAQDGILQSEDDSNCAWHSGNLDGNLNYLSVEVCQSMGDLDVLKHNEEKAFQLVASKCIQYGITPNENTIRLHQEVYATSCPHRSVETSRRHEVNESIFYRENQGSCQTTDSEAIKSRQSQKLLYGIKRMYLAKVDGRSKRRYCRNCGTKSSAGSNQD